MGDGMDLEEAPKEAIEEPAVPPEPELPSEFEKLFKGCEENPEDFNGWVYLLQYVEQEVNTEDVYLCYCCNYANEECTDCSQLDFLHVRSFLT